MSVSAIGPEKSHEIKSVTNIYSQGGAPTAKKSILRQKIPPKSFVSVL